jgi:hypothetical protein
VDLFEYGYPDVLPFKSREIYCLHVEYPKGRSGTDFQYCLCLVPAGQKPDEYERVGLCAWNMYTFSIKCRKTWSVTRRTIAIV